MKKKFLNFALVGAVVLSSSLTFTGCNYDDDFKNLQTQIDAVVSDIASLKSTVGEFVKSISYDEATGVLTVVDQSGNKTTYKTHQEIPSYDIKFDGNTLYVNGKAQGSVVLPNYTVEIVGNKVVLKADGTEVSSAQLPAGCEWVDYTVEIVDGYVILKGNGAEISRTPLPTPAVYTVEIIDGNVVLKADGVEVSRTPLPAAVAYTAELVGNQIILYADGVAVSTIDLPEHVDPSYTVAVENGKVVLYKDGQVVSSTDLPETPQPNYTVAIENGKVVLYKDGVAVSSDELPTVTEPTYSVAVENGEVVLYKDGVKVSSSKLPEAKDPVLTMGEDGYIYVNNVKSDVQVPNVGDYISYNKEKGTVTLNIDGEAVTFYILDSLPVYGVEFLPAYYTEYGFPAMVFDMYRYNPVDESGKTVSTIDGTKRMSSYFDITLPGEAHFVMNPLATTEAQLNTESFLLKEQSIAIVDTRAGGNNLTAKYASLENGLLKVKFEVSETAAKNYVGQSANDKKLAALQFTTAAGETITSEYVAVAGNKNQKVISIANKDVYNNNKATSHYSTKLSDALALNAALSGTQDALVLKVVNGTQLDLSTKVLACAGDAHSTFSTNTYGMYYTFSSIEKNKNVVNGTDQQDFCTVENGIFTARTYNTEGASAIGRTPIVKIELRDSRNQINGKDALVAVAFAKVLITDKVLEPVVIPEIQYPTKEFTLNCDAMSVQTDVEWMNLNVYNKVGLSKEEFYQMYALDATATKYYKDGVAASQKGAVSEITNPEVATNTNMVKYELGENEVEKAGLYSAVVTYKKQLTGFANLPEVVTIRLSINVKLPEVKTIVNDNLKKEAYAWDGNTVLSRGVGSSDGIMMYTDLEETFFLDKYLGQYSSNVRPDKYEFRIKQNENDGTLDGTKVVLKKTLGQGDKVDVDVELYVIWNDCLELKADAFKVRFENAAKFDIIWTGKKLAMADLLEGYSLDVANAFKIIHTGTGEVLYENGAVTDEGKQILGGNPTIVFTEGTSTNGYSENFSLTGTTLTWSRTEGNYIAEGKQVSCNVDLKLDFGNTTAGYAKCTIKSAIPVKVYNQKDYDKL